MGSIAGNTLGGRYADRSVDRAVLRPSWTLAAVCRLYWAAAPSAVGAAVFLLLFLMVWREAWGCWA
ncbi:hypothetical protein [Streptomyces sp. NPDC090445]|uniref:hypothetical protein n=1 Tax=Streptomyces sp. NPDC090445 TaxID=3365963 RepID=UPI003826D6C2